MNPLFLNTIKNLLANSIKPYSAILFLNNKYAGFFLLLITFINPSVAISGIVSIVFTILFAEFIGLKDIYSFKGFYVYNSLLVGMGIGFIFTPSVISIVLISIASCLTFMLSFVLNRLFSTYHLPILSLPFSIVTMFIYLASLKYSGLLSSLVNNASVYDIDLPLIVSGFLKSFGSIFFLPNNIAGILILILILYFSRIVVIMAVVGYYFGVFIHSYLIGSFEQALYDPYAFNYILVAIALCGIFLLPTIKNFILALIGVAISVILTDAIGVLFNFYAIPVFTLPFNITVIIFIFTLSVIYYKEFNGEIKSTPEKSLSNYLSQMFRFAKNTPKVSLPFSGEWSVYQAFDDEWTHKGIYQFAYDFVKLKDAKTYKQEGNETEDYYAFGESILSPVSGYVVDYRQDLVDNVIGEVDTLNNWGNYIIIKSDSGFFVEISHLMEKSINVSIGQYIKVNTIIAKCGNSGYSPQPHIHIQVQEFGLIGGVTKEFLFSEYIDNDRLVFNTLPRKGESVEAVVTNKKLSSRFLFMIDDIFSYEVFEDGKKTAEVSFIVKMTELGKFYLEDKAKNELYFYNDLKQFYFYDYKGVDSHLKWMFKVLPRIPFISNKKLTFEDYLPVYLMKTKFETICIELCSIVKKDFYKLENTYKFDERILSSKIGSATIGENTKGIVKLEYKNIILKRHT